MELFKDGVTMEVTTAEQEKRFRELGYRGRGEENPTSLIDKLKDENEKIKEENQKLLKQVERLKNK